jgi:hypothetical protein
MAQYAPLVAVDRAPLGTICIDRQASGLLTSSSHCEELLRKNAPIFLRGFDCFASTSLRATRV